jgi:uncharacterized membrane protein YesL
MWRIVSRGVDFVGLSLFWAALCLPVVTIGPATAALYYTVVKTFRQKEEGAFGVYWKAFCKNLRTGIPATLISLALLVVLAYGHAVMVANNGSDLGKVMYMAYYVVLVVPVGTLCYLFPLMGRFAMSLGQLWRTAFFLAMRHLPSTVIITMLTVELVIFTAEKWWPIFFSPVLALLLTSLFLERIFPKYLSEEQTAVLQNKPPQDEDA